ncbi:MAG: AAA family ATPase [Rubrobacter sp.]
MREIAMILFINGPFGVGKSSVARVLVEESPNAMIYDPEVIGSALRRLPWPIKKAEDFQDYALWRRLVVAVARALRATSSRTLVIPMTVWRRDYFDPIVAGLRSVDPDLSCFRLTASESELLRRISSDSVDTGAYGWRVSHAEVCLGASQDPAFGVEVPTDGLMPAEVADRILDSIETPTG